MPNFPTSKDDSLSLPNPGGTDKQNSPDHAALHTAENGAIIAVEAKLGTGATTPAANTLLIGTGAGTSAWSQLTSAQLASILSDETGTGLAVFGTSPTLVSPKVDTINENTPTNGVTIDGLNIKDSKLNTNDSVVTSNITNDNVTYIKLLSTIFGGQVVSTTNSGTAGGTLKSLNLGGVKLAWGITAQSAAIVTNGSVTGTVVFPTSFFATVTAHTTSPGTLTLDGRLGAYISPVSATGMTLNFQSFAATNNATLSISWFVIGT